MRQTYDHFRELFGRDDQLVIAIATPNVFDIDFLDRLRAMHIDIENELPSVEEVSSLINARSTRGEGDRLIVGELLKNRPTSPVELAEIERLVRANPMYENLLISEDARFATILVRTTPIRRWARLATRWRASTKMAAKRSSRPRAHSSRARRMRPS